MTMLLDGVMGQRCVRVAGDSKLAAQSRVEPGMRISQTGQQPTSVTCCCCQPGQTAQAQCTPQRGLVCQSSRRGRSTVDALFWSCTFPLVVEAEARCRHTAAYNYLCVGQARRATLEVESCPSRERHFPSTPRSRTSEVVPYRHQLSGSCGDSGWISKVVLPGWYLKEYGHE